VLRLGGGRGAGKGVWGLSAYDVCCGWGSMGWGWGGVGGGGGLGLVVGGGGGGGGGGVGVGGGVCGVCGGVPYKPVLVYV